MQNLSYPWTSNRWIFGGLSRLEIETLSSQNMDPARPFAWMYFAFSAAIWGVSNETSCLVLGSYE